MSALLAGLAILLVLALALFVDLALVLRHSERQPWLRAEVIDLGDATAISVRFSPGTLRKRVTIETITLERELARALDARPPEGFAEVSFAPPTRAGFEPDLSELGDQRDGAPDREQAIAVETERQYREAIEAAAEDARRNLHWTGRFVIRAGADRVLRIPASLRAPTSGRVSFGYRLRPGLFWKASSGCSVELRRA